MPWTHERQHDVLNQMIAHDSVRIEERVRTFASNALNLNSPRVYIPVLPRITYIPEHATISPVATQTIEIEIAPFIRGRPEEVYIVEMMIREEFRRVAE